MDGVREVLDALTAHGVRLAIGSSGPLPNLELTVLECGLDGRFAAIASLEDITRGKPDPQVFLVAAAKAGGDPSRSVVFEDAPVGHPGGEGRRDVRRRCDHDGTGRRRSRRRAPTRSSPTSSAMTCRDSSPGSRPGPPVPVHDRDVVGGEDRCGRFDHGPGSF